ncbi:MAG: M3 family metallopeptidase [Planctomycetota bacterium]
MLAPWKSGYGGVPPWDQVQVEQFESAFETAIAQAQQGIAEITSNQDPATFENTVVPLEQSGAMLNRLEVMFDLHTSNLNIGMMPNLERIISPRMQAYRDSITQNDALFQRIESIRQGDDFGALTIAQQRLVDQLHKDFVRRGARLSAGEKSRLSQINTRLSRLFTDFGQHVLDEENGYVTWIQEESQLAGLPQGTIDAMAASATERGGDNPQGKWAVTNTRSSMEPFLTYSAVRQLRQKVWENYYSRGDNGNENDNNAVITEILGLRAARAKLLGYETHAHWRLEPTMAKDPQTAMDLMLQVWPKAVQRVREEVVDMQAIADEEFKNGVIQEKITIQPWDYRFYAEAVRKAKYDLDMGEVEPYLQLEKMVEGMMWSASELFGFQFTRIRDVPLFHPDVRVFRVDNAAGDFQGLFYLDPYARPGKRSGAWMTEYRTQKNLGGSVRPIVSNNSNFIKPSGDAPALVSWDDATTLFHEFGHALHGLSSQVDYPSQAGTNVARDYVEFPSQVYEAWLSTPRMLQRFAVHHETGEPMPAELLQKILNASKFNQGFSTVEYLASALVDMKLHLAGDRKIDPDVFEKETLLQLNMPGEVVMRHRTPHFQHIFSSDAYSAGYYSYLWSDALTADAAEAFEESEGGFYDENVSRRLMDHVLSIGDTIDPADGFRKFRGRDVDTNALLRKRGFAPEK